ncbi:hypothetical protein SLE2022_317560 [Rubroshorea leprosula]
MYLLGSYFSFSYSRGHSKTMKRKKSEENKGVLMLSTPNEKAEFERGLSVSNISESIRMMVSKIQRNCSISFFDGCLAKTSVKRY